MSGLALHAREIGDVDERPLRAVRNGRPSTRPRHSAAARHDGSEPKLTHAAPHSDVSNLGKTGRSVSVRHADCFTPKEVVIPAFAEMTGGDLLVPGPLGGSKQGVNVRGVTGVAGGYWG